MSSDASGHNLASNVSNASASKQTSGVPERWQDKQHPSALCRPPVEISVLDSRIGKHSVVNALEQAYREGRIDPISDSVVKITFAEDSPLRAKNFQQYLQEKFKEANGSWQKRVQVQSLTLDAVDDSGLAFFLQAKSKTTTMKDYINGNAFGRERPMMEAHKYFDHKYLAEMARIHPNGTRYDLAYANDLQPSFLGDHRVKCVATDFAGVEDVHSDLDVILESDVGGVNTNYFYVARAGSMAAIHVEDFSLFSLNVMFPSSQPKIWLCFNQRYMQKINAFISASEKLAMPRETFCENHLRHKCFILSWQLLEHLNVPYSIVTQESGTCIISLAGGYHQTFSTGVSFSEAKNFVIQHRWLETAMRTLLCDNTCEMHRRYWDAPGWAPLKKLLYGGDLLLRVNTKCVRKTLPEHDFRQGFACDAVLITNAGNTERAAEECNPLEIRLRDAFKTCRGEITNVGNAAQAVGLEVSHDDPVTNASTSGNTDTDTVSGEVSADNEVIGTAVEMLPETPPPPEQVSTHTQMSIVKAVRPRNKVASEPAHAQHEASPRAEPPVVGVPPPRLADALATEPIKRKLRHREVVNDSAARKRTQDGGSSRNGSQLSVDSEDQRRANMRGGRKPTSSKTGVALTKRKAADRLLLSSDSEDDDDSGSDFDLGNASKGGSAKPKPSSSSKPKKPCGPPSRVSQRRTGSQGDVPLVKLTVNIANWNRDVHSLDATISDYIAKKGFYPKKIAGRPKKEAEWEAHRREMLADFQGRLQRKSQQLQVEITMRIVYRALKKYYATKYNVTFADQFAMHGFTDPRQIVSLFWAIHETEVRHALFFLCVEQSVNDFIEYPERYDEWRARFTCPQKMDEFFGVQRTLRVPAVESSAVLPPTDLTAVLNPCVAAARPNAADSEDVEGTSETDPTITSTTESPSTSSHATDSPQPGTSGISNFNRASTPFCVPVDAGQKARFKKAVSKVLHESNARNVKDIWRANA